MNLWKFLGYSLSEILTVFAAIALTAAFWLPLIQMFDF